MMTQTEGRGGDIWGGLAAMLVALPSSIAFGVVIYSILGAQYAAQGALAGVLGAVAVGITAPLFGGTPRLISAPCAPAAAVLSALALKLSAGGAAVAPEHVLLLLTLSAFLGGVLQFLYGAIGGGTLIKYIPYPVVTGYLSGVAVLIFLSQVPKLFGFPRGVSLWAGLSSPENWQWPGLAVGAATIATTLLAPRVTRKIPASILGLAGGLLAYLCLGLLRPEMLSLEGNSLIIGPIGAGASAFADSWSRWSSFGRLSLADLKLLAGSSLTLSILLSIDTLKTCVVIDTLTRTRHDSNRELRGQGLGNIASAALGGMPGAGTMGATLVNINSGGRTQRSSVLEGVFVLAAFLLFGRLIAWVPIPALAAILIVVAWRMFDGSLFRLLRQRSTFFDFIVAAAVIIVAIFADLIAASGAGLGLAIILFIRDQIRGSVIRRKLYGSKIFSKQRRLPAELEFLEKNGDQTVVCELQGNLFFGTTDQLFSQLEADLGTKKFVILDMRRVQSVDFTAAHMLDQMQARLAERGGCLIFSHLPVKLPTGQELQSYFDQVGLIKPSRNVRIFEQFDSALEWTEDQILDGQSLRDASPETPLELREIDLLRDFEGETLAALQECCRQKSLAAGERLFSHGDAGDELFLIRRGSIKILIPLEGGNDHHLATFARGDFFGEMSFLDRGLRSAHAVASSSAELAVLSRSRFNAMAAGREVLAVKVFARLALALALRLRQTNAELGALQQS